MRQVKSSRRVADLLEQYYRERGWTQQELIRKSGVPQQTVEDILRGATRRPRLDTLRKLSDALGLTSEQAALLYGAVRLDLDDLHEVAKYTNAVRLDVTRNFGSAPPGTLTTCRLGQSIRFMVDPEEV